MKIITKPFQCMKINRKTIIYGITKAVFTSKKKKSLVDNNLKYLALL